MTYFNNMVLVLDRYYVHRLLMVTGKDGNPLNEVELLAEPLMNNDQGVAYCGALERALQAGFPTSASDLAWLAGAWGGGGETQRARTGRSSSRSDARCTRTLTALTFGASTSVTDAPTRAGHGQALLASNQRSARFEACVCRSLDPCGTGSRCTASSIGSSSALQSWQSSSQFG